MGGVPPPHLERWANCPHIEAWPPFSPVTSVSQAEAAREATGASSVMIARGAMWNASAFGMAPVHKLQVCRCSLETPVMAWRCAPPCDQVPPPTDRIPLERLVWGVIQPILCGRKEGVLFGEVPLPCAWTRQQAPEALGTPGVIQVQEGGPFRGGPKSKRESETWQEKTIRLGPWVILGGGHALGVIQSLLALRHFGPSGWSD